MSDEAATHLELDRTWAENAMQNVFTTLIEPEIQRRREAGALPDDFRLLAAQIIFTVDTAPPIVRLNSEVRSSATGKALREDLVVGQPEFIHDISDIEAIELTDEDPNAAHVTLIRQQDRWVVHFNCLYNATRVSEIIDVVEQFLVSSADALTKAHLHAFVENLWSASELLAKAYLLWVPDPRVVETKKHEFLRSQFNIHGSLGNVEREAVELLNEITKLRSPARYVNGPLELTARRAHEMLHIAEKFYEFIKDNNPRRTQKT